MQDSTQHLYLRVFRVGPAYCNVEMERLVLRRLLAGLDLMRDEPKECWASKICRVPGGGVHVAFSEGALLFPRGMSAKGRINCSLRG